MLDGGATFWFTKKLNKDAQLRTSPIHNGQRDQRNYCININHTFMNKSQRATKNVCNRRVQD